MLNFAKNAGKKQKKNLYRGYSLQKNIICQTEPFVNFID